MVLHQSLLSTPRIKMWDRASDLGHHRVQYTCILMEMAPQSSSSVLWEKNTVHRVRRGADPTRAGSPVVPVMLCVASSWYLCLSSLLWPMTQGGAPAGGRVCLGSWFEARVLCVGSVTQMATLCLVGRQRDVLGTHWTFFFFSQFKISFCCFFIVVVSFFVSVFGGEVWFHVSLCACVHWCVNLCVYMEPHGRGHRVPPLPLDT